MRLPNRNGDWVGGVNHGFFIAVFIALIAHRHQRAGAIIIQHLMRAIATTQGLAQRAAIEQPVIGRGNIQLMQHGRQKISAHGHGR